MEPSTPCHLLTAVQVRCRKAKDGCTHSPVTLYFLALPGIPITPSCASSAVPVGLITAGEKHTPRLPGLTSGSRLCSLPSPVSAAYLSFTGPHQPSSSSPIFPLRDPVSSSWSPWSEGKRPPLTGSPICLRACVLSSVPTVKSVPAPGCG